MNTKRKAKKAKEVARYHYLKDDFQKALKSYLRAVSYTNSLEYFRELNYHCIAYCYKELWDIDRAKTYILKALDFAPWYMEWKFFYGELLILNWEEVQWKKIITECRKLEKELDEQVLDIDTYYRTK
jgi:tetratricopeptide (TPR) repeat protein